jgi:hypothetical protein
MIVACKLEGRAMSKVRIIAGFDIGEILMLAAGVLAVAAIIFAI